MKENEEEETIHLEDAHQEDLPDALLVVLEDLLLTLLEEDLQAHVINEVVNHHLNHRKAKEVQVDPLHQKQNLALV